MLTSFRVLREFTFGLHRYYPGQLIYLADEELHHVYGFKLQGWIE